MTRARRFRIVTTGNGNELNGLRHRNQPRWFDFWNVRVVLPDQGRYFYLMPYVLSGSELGDVSRLHVYDGGNGGPSGNQQVGVLSVEPGAWSAATDECAVAWRRNGAESEFRASSIRALGPTTTWDVRVEPFLGERFSRKETRRQEFLERQLLRRVSFIHRVPQIKGFATGTIEQLGVVHRVERAPFYQAKNHGHAFPRWWLWIHANVLDSDERLGFEIAAQETEDGVSGLMRIGRPGEIETYTTWTGDHVRVGRDGDRYRFEARAKDGGFLCEGEAVHGEGVRFAFPAPQGGTYENEECLLGELSVQLGRSRMTSRFAALGRARLNHAPRSGEPTSSV